MFCKLYGGGTKKVAYLTDTTVSEAQEFVDDFNEKLPGVNRFMNQMVNRAQREGRIENAFGRYYYIDKNFAYKAVNYLVQGSSADILKRAMIRIDRLFQERWQGCQLLLTLHDELVMEVPLKYHSKRLMREIITEMQTDSSLVKVPVPLPVGMKIAPKRWSETIEIDSLKAEWKDKFICKKKS
jgi:DNA polymerase-1